MKSGHSLLCTLILSTLGVPALTSAEDYGASFEILWYPASIPRGGISADGQVVVGTALIDGEAFRWTRDGGIVGLGQLVWGHGRRGYTYAEGVSGDGRVVVGTGRASECWTCEGRPYVACREAFRWTPEGGMEGLGHLGECCTGGDSRAYATSANGEVVVGMSRVERTCSVHAFRWTPHGGMTDFGERAAYSISADASVIVGWCDPSSEACECDGWGYRWTEEGGVECLEVPQGYHRALPLYVSANGRVVVGIVSYNERSQLYDAAYWTDEGVVVLGRLPGFENAKPQGVSGNGTTIVGVSSSDNPYRSESFLWREHGGMRDLRIALAEYGIDVSALKRSSARAVCADGTVLVGRSGGTPAGWRAVVPRPMLLFRERSQASWGFDGDFVPGKDHVGLFTTGRVLESHQGYKIEEQDYWDPLQYATITIVKENGVQAQLTLGSFQHASTTRESTALNWEVPIPPLLAVAMAEHIDKEHMDDGYIPICKRYSMGCWRRELAPKKQKGADGRFTCCGLIEHAAEEVGHNNGQGFIPDRLESILGIVPTLSPELLYWASSAQEAFGKAKQAITGWLDPVDFVSTDPQGRRLGFTEATGKLMEVPGAYYDGNGDVEQFLILDPVPGKYRLELVGLGKEVEVALGGSIAARTFAGFLQVGERREIEFTLSPCPADCDDDNDLDLADYAIFGDCMTGPNTPLDARCKCLDLDLDNDIDLADFSILQSAFGCS